MLEPDGLTINNKMSIYHLNIRSARNKIDQLCASWSRPPDILCLSEHWLREDEPLIIPNFVCASKFCRGSGIGGGVSIYYNINSSVVFNVTSVRNDLVQKFCDVSCFEFSIVNINVVNSISTNHNLKFVLICLYRAPHNREQEFIVKLEQLLHKLKTGNEFIMICGDWNVNFLDSTSPTIRRIRNILMSFNLSELVKQATRVTEDSSSLLDNVVTNLDSNMIE